MHHFADRLNAAIQEKGTPLVVGLDPRSERIPESLRPDNRNDLAAMAEGFRQFSCEIIDAVAAHVPAVKPQAAFFEMLGAAGTDALSKVVTHARNAGLVVIMDAKRGDIGSTAEAYAQAYLGHTSPWGCDSLTVNPYLGADTLEPFVKAAEEQGAGLFVLAKTSNPGSNMIQDVESEGKRIYVKVAQLIQELSSRAIGASGYGSIGAVVGATYPEQLAELRSEMPQSILLIPGLGAQGGTAADVAAGFDEQGLGAVINSSRAIIFAYENEQYKTAGDWQKAVEQATIDTANQIAAETTAGKLR